jgi:hypothetical protein
LLLLEFTPNGALIQHTSDERTITARRQQP